MKQSYKSAAIEVISVVFAVLFALGVNAWYDDYKNKQFADEALVKIIKEISLNTDELKAQKLELDSLIPNLDRYIFFLEGNKIQESIDLDFEHPTFYTTAWETAKITDVIRDMNYDKVLEINAVYEGLSFYKHLVSKLVNHFLSKDFHDENTRKAHIKSMRTIAKNLKNINAETVISHLDLLESLK